MYFSKDDSKEKLLKGTFSKDEISILNSFKIKIPNETNDSILKHLLCLTRKHRDNLPVKDPPNLRFREASAMFSKNRAEFYDKIVCRRGVQEDPKVIFDETKRQITCNPKVVKHVILREAKKIVACGHDKPEELPKWAENAYSRNAKKVNKGIWEPLVEDFTVTDIKDYLKGPVKTPGVDNISKELLRLIFDSSCHFGPTLTEMLAKLLSD